MWATCRNEDTSYRSRTVWGRARSRTKCVGTRIELSTRCSSIVGEGRLGVEALVDDERHARQLQPDGGQRSVVVQRAGDQVHTELGEPVRRDVVDEAGEVGRPADRRRRELDRLGPSRGAGREQQVGDDSLTRVQLERCSVTDDLGQLRSFKAVVGKHDDQDVEAGHGVADGGMGRRVDECQPGTSLSGEVLDLAGGQLEVDRYRRRLSERRRSVHEDRRRSVASDDEQAPVGAEVELVDCRGEPQGGVRHRRPRRVAVGVRADRPPVRIGRGSSHEGEGDHLARTEQTLIPGAPYTWVNAVVGSPGTWRSPARPCSWRTHSIT